MLNVPFVWYINCLWCIYSDMFDVWMGGLIYARKQTKKWKQVTSPSVFALAHGKVSLIRRVFLHWHTAKIETLPCASQMPHGKLGVFAVCLPSTALGKPAINGRPPSRFLFFAECVLGTRQNLCRVSYKRHSAKPALPTKVSPSVFCRVQNGLCRVPRALGKEGKSGSVKGHK